MKIIPSRRALVLLAACLALAAPAGYLLRRFYTRVVLGMSESEVSRARTLREPCSLSAARSQDGEAFSTGQSRQAAPDTAAGIS